MLDLEYMQEAAAQLAHEANRVYCESIGDMSLSPWHDTPKNIKDSALNGVKFIWDGTKTPADSHANWLEFKRADGWRYGEIKDAEAKTHPAFVHYDELPEAQKIKDYIFRSVVLGYKAMIAI